MISQSFSKRAWMPISLVLILMIVLFAPVNAYADGTVSLKLETALVQPGSVVQVPVIIESNPGLASMKIMVKYDDTVLTLTDVTFPKNTGTYSSVPEPYTANQIINIVSPLSAFTKTGNFAYLTFSVNQDVELNTVSNILIEYEEDDVFDMDLENIPVACVNGAICVSEGDQENIALLPSALSTITEESFMDTAFYYVVLPETTTTIESKAFANCKNLEYIYIPETTTSIAEDAFQNVTNLTILGKDGSYAQFFASRKGFAFQAQ